MTDNLNWMYKRPTVDTEAYLLGKAIDKSVEHIETDGVPTNAEDIGNKPGALFLEAAASAALEAELKVREDPLYAIKKKEEEQRRALLNNPIRLKMMQEELERKQAAAEKKKSSKLKDKDLLVKMLQLKAKHGTDIKNLLADDSDDERDKKRRKRRHSRSRSRSADRKSFRDRRTSDSHRAESPVRSHRSHTHASDQSSRRSTSYHSSSHASSSHHTSSRHEHRNPPPTKTSQYTKTGGSRTFGKMDPAELERKRLEMMSDAKVRDEERAKNVADYRKQDAEEEARNRSGGSRGSALSSTADIGTLESRIQSTRNKLQRTRAALEKDFTKR
ncbi:pre-mRNA-splicing factor CWC25 homolog [Paramacrobiotus metropolitanus]|uniref:pre-mRNA-splicing factor CWC25 homolog n=1 Tax=Paramacrobiotus metropolitanus TaxID=2943436 RepID=UPI0024462F77|nr:pre-mRNA-splicing factor CWC25 homolog [Paramacrobiotus metropolitanus]XP_055343420.1 pre-mRNA-splicing factor CWC25 homolog [Paramacrobiotus metropolitanus]XP_055343421.1 pre-mRNA-splicing factor CWC25 homolog [Paramacrobiotus metropolitanus]XP_055343422.1 pre-mRNA-splicing factor CWC25 homolog [Paramacrobiotus metropolitanus]